MAPIAALGGCSCCSGLVCRYSGELTDVRAAAVSWAVTATRWRMFVLQRSHRPLQRRLGGYSCCNGVSDRYSGGMADARAAAVSQIVTAADWRIFVLQRSRMPLQRRNGGGTCCSGLACRYSGEMAEARTAAVSQIVAAKKEDATGAPSNARILANRTKCSRRRSIQPKKGRTAPSRESLAAYFAGRIARLLSSRMIRLIE